MTALPSVFAPRLIAWQRQAGRHGLPWQGTRDPYRVWLSEIMLQQTQVSTVLGYYPRFLARFPDVTALAAAPVDDVMALWSGLGYYSRARNLHRCAQAVVAQHGGQFPRSAIELQTLPGIGASTAAAIAAFCFGERVSILDGNVRRVLARVLAFDGDLAETAPQRALAAQAQALLPASPMAEDMAAYTQGLMDLGATVCTRSKPRCTACPMADLCAARCGGEPQRYPVKTRKLVRRFERWWLLLLTQGDAVWLQRRPERGIWAGLYAPPVFDSELALRSAVGALADALQAWPAVSHSLTHRELQLLPHRLVAAPDAGLPGQWVALADALNLGLPAPVRTMLQALPDQPLPQ
jgi:A/G-specific adenine glycosylase